MRQLDSTSLWLDHDHLLTSENDQGNEVRVEPNELLYRFCFVEKNRIDSFSRIAARAPVKNLQQPVNSSDLATQESLEVYVNLVRLGTLFLCLCTG